MDELRVAAHFHRWDVDQFKEEIDTDLFAEWVAFFSLEPEGWHATRIQTQRLSYMLAATHSSKRVKERDFDIVIGGNLRSDEAERARWEAMSIRTSIASQGEEETADG